MDHAPLQHFFKQWDLNMCQTQWLQGPVDALILVVYWLDKQDAFSNTLSHSSILNDCIDKSADY